jgi:hypothetical protein
MHAARNVVPIPLDEIERILVARAVPDFTGNVLIDVRVLPTAGHEVEFSAETETHLALNRSEEISQPIVTNDRVNKVRRVLREVETKFVLRADVIGIRASFVKGELRSFKLCEVEKNERTADSIR